MKLIHEPQQYALSGSDNDFVVVTKNNRFAKATVQCDREFAEFIVTACNSHAVLLAAVRLALNSEDGPALRDVLRAALSYAGGMPDDSCVVRQSQAQI